MSNYYYLASSLPILFFHHGLPFISFKTFIDDCKRLMKPGDYAQLSIADLNSDHYYDNATGTFKAWQNFNFALRNELVRQRAKKLDVDPQQFIRPYYTDPSLAETVKDNIEDFTPLQAELHLMELQWIVLDYLQSGHMFDLDFLIIYALKLQILERKASFIFETGKERFDHVIRGSE
ncbi:MAG TPA: hypothetical protein VKY57_16775 [Chitinispirillaceae bacterium]|jgi:hypothetical protein|nr:hypothetical protein [Chitinispirillaceae bacterium]